MTTCVVGLGKIGLPLAVQIASKGERVIGADISSKVVDLVNKGEEPFPGEFDLANRLHQVISEGLLEATTETAEAVRASENVIVVVPLIVDDQARPDFSAIDAATVDVANGLHAGSFISYETTLPIGTTRDRFKPALESVSSLACGEDFFLCHSPERVFSGRIFEDLRRYPKLIGGVDELSTARAISFYESILDFDERPDLDRPNGVWDLGSSEAAEMAKLVETTYRNVNIALANEFALHAQEIGLDIASVIEASNSQPFSHVHQPGVAVGGHCIPVYPKFYLTSDTSALLPEVAIKVNESMPGRVVSMAKEEVGDLQNKKVVVLGASYRGGVKETAFSGVFPLSQEIKDQGGIPLVHDPMFTEEELMGLGLQSYQLGEECDVVIVQSDHEVYGHLSAEDIPGATHLFDGRKVVDATLLHPVQVFRLGNGQRRK